MGRLRHFLSLYGVPDPLSRLQLCPNGVGCGSWRFGWVGPPASHGPSPRPTPEDVVPILDGELGVVQIPWDSHALYLFNSASPLSNRLQMHTRQLAECGPDPCSSNHFSATSKHEFLPSVLLSVREVPPDQETS